MSLALMVCILAMVPVSAAQARFEDIGGHWAKESIERMADLGIVNGMSETEFAPDASITREQFIKLLVTAAEFPTPILMVTHYADVPLTKWSTKYINVAVSAGVLRSSGKSDTFRPEDPITRQDMAVWVQKTLQLPLSSTKPQFEDRSKITHANQVMAAVESGIMEGDGGNFRPRSGATRAEAVAVIERCIDYIAANPREYSLIQYCMTNEIITLVNAERRAYGLSELKLNEELIPIAFEKSEDMAEYRSMSHYSERIGDLGDMLDVHGFPYLAWGDNLAAGYTTPEKTVEAWMGSSSHRKLILSEVYTDAGAGISIDDNGKYYWSLVLVALK